MSNFSKIDIEVFSFINSDKCTSYPILEEYLRRNAYPLREKWVYYFWGKHKYLTNEINSPVGELDLHEDIVEYILEKLSHWKYWLENKDDALKR